MGAAVLSGAAPWAVPALTAGRRLPPHQCHDHLQITLRVMLALPQPGWALGSLAPGLWRLGRALTTAAASASSHALADGDRIFTNLYGR